MTTNGKAPLRTARASGKTIVVLGMMSKRPWAGIVWITAQYLVGLQRLGYDVFYVESHACTPSMFVQNGDDGSRGAARFIDGVMNGFGMRGRWAFHALHSDGVCYGLSDTKLRRLYRSADLLLNLHGATTPLQEHSETGGLVYVGTDPVQIEVEVHHGVDHAIEFLEPHVAFFTWGENHGRPGCGLPVSDRFRFEPTRQPIVLDFWRSGASDSDVFTTVGNWKQDGNEVVLDGEVYHWSKHLEFLKFLELPARTGQAFELALSSCDDDARGVLEAHGWRVRDALSLSAGVDRYRSYIASSLGEFTVAKDQNVRLRTGWFSDRSASYLAAARPVITQETGFSDNLPTGQGLFAFTTMDEAVAAVEAIRSDPERCSRAASAVAREYFSHDVVLPALLSAVGIRRPASRPARARCLTSDLDLVPVSRRPPRLAPATAKRVLAAAIPEASAGRREIPATVAIATCDNLPFLKLCVESVLRDDERPLEVVVVDNGSRDGTGEYLEALTGAHPGVRRIANQRNVGFAASMNQALESARGDVVVLLNDDVVVSTGWLSRLVRHLDNPAIGLVGAVTNRSSDEAEIPSTYRTFGEFLDFAAGTARSHTGTVREVDRLAMLCSAMRRSVFERIGPLDERFGRGMFEDDDYVCRIREAGLAVACAEDVFVHHFGGATIGRLAVNGEYGDLFHENRRRYEEKWQVQWRPPRRRANAEYTRLRDRVRAAVRATVPPGTTILVTSRGDDALLEFEGVDARHFPAAGDGSWAGYHPADSAAAISLLEAERARGAAFLVLPSTAFWWLDFYDAFKTHVDGRYPQMQVAGDSCRIFDLSGASVTGGEQ